MGFQLLSARDRRDALEVAAGLCGSRAFLLEKDIWVVQTLSALFGEPFGRSLVFKGGTSLSKAYRAIRRFSEDVDVTYDIRDFAPELVAASATGPLPPTRSQEKRWTRIIRTRLAEWTQEEALPALADSMIRSGWPVRLRADEARIHMAYDPLFADYGFVRPDVVVEFGARSTGEPHHRRTIECEAARFLPGIRLPTAAPSVMAAERTFWEKATAIHVFCRRRRPRGHRLSRHWHDLVRLDDAGYAGKALLQRKLAHTVARHKSVFFRERDEKGHWIDYQAAVSGDLQLLPAPPLREILSADYDRMRRDGMLLGEEDRFEEILHRCADIQDRANSL